MYRAEAHYRHHVGEDPSIQTLAEKADVNNHCRHHIGYINIGPPSKGFTVDYRQHHRRTPQHRAPGKELLSTTMSTTTVNTTHVGESLDTDVPFLAKAYCQQQLWTPNLVVLSWPE